MKSLIIYIFLSFALFTDTKAQHFMLNCTSEAFTDQSKALLKIEDKIDTLIYKDGKLNLDGLSDFAGMAELDIDYEGNNDNVHIYYLFLSEGTVNLNITDISGLDRPEVTGNKNAMDFEYQLRRPVSEMNVQIKKTGKRLMGAGNLDSAGVKAIQKLLEEQVYVCFQIPVKYINANPGSPVSIEALKFLGKGEPAAKITPADLQVLFASLSPEIRSSQAGLKYAEKLHKMLSE